MTPSADTHIRTVIGHYDRQDAIESKYYAPIGSVMAHAKTARSGLIADIGWKEPHNEIIGGETR